MNFPIGFFGCFESVSSKYIKKTNKENSHEDWKDQQTPVPPPPKKKVHRLGPMDLKIYRLVRNYDCESIADKISRISPTIISVTSISGHMF
jgi:hypothetical protein